MVPIKILHLTQTQVSGIVRFALIKKIQNYAVQLARIFNLHICIDKYKLK